MAKKSKKINGFSKMEQVDMENIPVKILREGKKVIPTLYRLNNNKGLYLVS